MRISDNQLLNLQKLNKYESFTKLLNQLKIGDVFKGKILEINQNKILLKTLNGMQVQARLSSEIELKVGQQLDFKVQSTNGNQIFIKPVLEQGEKSDLIKNALSAAGLPLSKDNVELVKVLLTHHLPIDKENLTSLSQLLRNNDTTPQALLFLLENNLEINDKNIQMLSNYINSNNSLTEQLDELVRDLVSFTKAHKNNEVLNVFIKNIDKDVIEQNILKHTNIDNIDTNLKTQVSNLTDETIILKDLDNVLDKLVISDNNKDLIKEEIIKNQLIKELFVSVDNKEDLLKLQNIYNKLINKMTEAENIIQQESTKTNSTISQVTSIMEKVSEDVKNITDNINFLSSINESMTFVHIPLQFTNSLTAGNLFLIEDKEGGGKSNKNSMKTALLSLDLAYLGHLEAYVGLSDKKVFLKIGVDNENIEKVFRSNVKTLNDKLDGLGYIVEGININILEKKYNFIEAKKLDNTVEEKRYSFDMKV